MPTFADSFWSSDYAGGLGILFSKLRQGVVENQQVLTIASMRAEAEEMYSERLGDIAPTIDRMTGGFMRDDGASVRKAYEGVRNEMIEATKSHQKVAMSIRELVVSPFSKWCDAHALRVQSAQEDLQSKIRAYDKQADAVKKLRSQYFGKCRLVEDLEEENKLAFQDPEKEQPSLNPSTSPAPKIILREEQPEELPVEIGDQTYSPEQMKKILTHMLEIIPLGEVKVPILGTYQNVSAGTDITGYIQKHMKASTVSYAEAIGQDLVDRGFLRLVGNVGNTFANSSKMKYQWRPRVWQITDIPEPKKLIKRVGTAGSSDSILDSPTIGNISETLSAWNPMNNPYPNETPAQKLKREAQEADDKYKAGVRRLDLIRCNLEESMMDRLKFLERCELDRLKAIKSVVLEFSGAISNVIPAFQSQVDNMLLYQETIKPAGDLSYLLENYRTGAYLPKVVPYENYYGSVDDQVFGVELEARARADRKRVPMIVTTILTFLDSHYPELEGDEARRGIWLTQVPLAATHHLRNAINNGAPIPRELLERYEVPIVASVLKLYLLELPDSLVSSQVYEIIKQIYVTTPEAIANPISIDSIDSTSRIQVLQSTLGTLRLNNIATLDAITTHFTRLIDLTSADEAYVDSLAKTLAPCVLRPKTENSLTLDEKHAYRLIRDLFSHKEAIFGELKRQSSTLGALGGSAGLANARPRAISSTDESSRRANMEERAKAIVERTRDKSPAPASRHGRGKSTDGSLGRFPVIASPTAAANVRNISGFGHRTSLEVPGNSDNSPVAERTHTPVKTQALPKDSPATNGGASPFFDRVSNFSGGGPGPHIPPPADDDSGPEDSAHTTHTLVTAAVNAATDATPSSPPVKRSAAGSGGRRRAVGSGLGSHSTRTSLDHATGHPNNGVTLTDKSMDD